MSIIYEKARANPAAAEDVAGLWHELSVASDRGDVR